MPCRHVRVEGKSFRVVSIKRTKKLPKGSKVLIPSHSKKRKVFYRRKRSRQNDPIEKMWGEH